MFVSQTVNRSTITIVSYCPKRSKISIPIQKVSVTAKQPTLDISTLTDLALNKKAVL